MGVILATFLFGMITIGFTLLTVMPLVFGYLAVAVYFELSGAAASPANAQAETVRASEQIEQRTRSTSVTGQEALTPGDHLVRAGG